MAGFFVHLAGGRCGKHACSYGHVTLFVLSAAPGQPTRNLDIVGFVLLWCAFCFVIASAVVRRRSWTSTPACDQIYFGRASWPVTRAHGLHHVLSNFVFGPHMFLWPLPGCEEAAASWAYDIVCSLNLESRDLVWLPRGGVLRPVPRMWDLFVPPAHTLLLRFLRASHAISVLGWVFADATADLISYP